jgi:ubiquinone/menaquinone biosynthesis C-methylase UbiE
MRNVNWNEFADKGLLQSVIDPLDSIGIKNSLIDQLQWNTISKQLKESQSLLDFGCGTGRFSERITQCGLSYFGVDSSAKMINAAEMLNTDIKKTFIHSDHLPVPFRDNIFDICLSVWVLQYLMHDHANSASNTLLEFSRVLAPHGKLLLIEQASASGRSSGTVAKGSTEDDYINALAKYFVIQRIERIRCSKMTLLSTLFCRYGKFIPRRRKIINFLAYIEKQEACRSNIKKLTEMDYYDIYIEAIKL